MFKQHTAEPKSRDRPTRAECCTESECESSTRNRYFVGKRLTPDAFKVEQRYLIERRHLMNRAVTGWGVVFGYPVKPGVPAQYELKRATGRLSIGGGLALDAAGRELLQTDTVELQVDDVLILDEKGRQSALRREHCDGCWLLKVHYAERDRGPTAITDPCNCEHQEWDRVCETVRFSLSPIDCDLCCRPPHCDLDCDCATGPCCGEIDERPSRDPAEQRLDHEHSHNPVRRGGCRCLCDYLGELDCNVDCENLCVIEEPCGRVRVDLSRGVPLACVKLEVDDCGCWTFCEEVEDCGPRRLVKRNDVLFDLIRGCDLTRICKIGWAPRHRARHPVPWFEFAESFGDSGPEGTYVTRDYWVEFSRPVRAATVRADCFAMTVLMPEGEGGWLRPLRVPIVGVATNEGDPDIPAEHVTRATVMVDSGWVEDAVRGRKTQFSEGETSVEIEVLGDYLVDCNGQAVDANAIGLSPAPTGNGVPGDRFVSKFHVERRPQLKQPPFDAKQSHQGV